jgi:uncharacterized damage-inducible protein DinB
MSTLPEPWLRGPIPGLHPLIAPILYAFQQAREDLALHAAGLTIEQVWATPHGFGSLGFHIRHIAGSTHRLMTYLEGKPLSESQMTALQDEHDPGAPLEQLLAEIDLSFQNAELLVRELHPNNLGDFRSMGRKHLPTTVIGLLTHIAEHTQRHVGQAIGAAKLARVGNLLPNQP